MSTPDLTNIDVVLMAGRPLRPEEYDATRWRVWAEAISNGVEAPPLYPGSISKNCAECGIEIQVGPRQQAAIAEIGDTKQVVFYCLIDGAVAAYDSAHPMPVHDLGNPHKEQP